MNKKLARLRRARKCRAKAKRLNMPRLSVHRTPRHIYAEVINTDGHVLAAASTVEKQVNASKDKTNMDLASIVGKLVAERAKTAGVLKLVFDRAGFKYHGRVKALAEAAREGGLDF